MSYGTDLNRFPGGYPFCGRLDLKHPDIREDLTKFLQESLDIIHDGQGKVEYPHAEVGVMQELEHKIFWHNYLFDRQP